MVTNINLKGLLFFAISFLSLSQLSAQDEAVVDINTRHQIIRGFGAANILQWRPDMTDSEIETAFGTGDGQLGFSILRLRIQPQQDQWITNVRSAKKAHDMGATIIASPWNPPDNMLVANSTERRLRPDMYGEYAEHLDAFSYFMESNGVPIYAISVQNEPDIKDQWTTWMPQEMLTFMRDYAPIIQTRVMAPESFQFRRDMTDPILNDSLACANLDIVAGHIYGAGLGPYPLAEEKGKEIWMTEHLTGSDDSGDDWTLAYRVAYEMHSVMEAGMSAYVWWYIVRYYGPISDGTNNSGQKGDVTKKGYAMSQFSRFIRPGFYRVACDPHPQRSVYITAYKDPESSRVVIVAINTSTSTREQTFVIPNGDIQNVTPYVSSETQNCERGAVIPMANDSFSMTLGGTSVTTFVSDDLSHVENQESHPEKFTLLQNYPNPFNPVTRIDFEISEHSFVSLNVYNLRGERVAELASQDYAPGQHSVIFDASHVANGVYLYTLKAGDFVSTKKMVIAK